MIYLAMTPQGMQDILASLHDRDAVVWCGADAISEADFNKLDYPGMSISRFDYPLAGADTEAMADALGTIREHHPGERIWVESVVNADAAGEPSSLVALSPVVNCPEIQSERTGTPLSASAACACSTNAAERLPPTRARLRQVKRAAGAPA